MTKFILRWAINAIALYLAVLLLPGIDLGSDLVSILWLALIFGLINALFRPLLQGHLHAGNRCLVFSHIISAMADEL